MNLGEWINLNDIGQYLGNDLDSNVKIYKKLLKRGVNVLDDTSSFYLFDFKGMTLEQLK